MDVKEATEWWMLLRDVLLVVTAIGLVVHEAVIWDGPFRAWVPPIVAAVGLAPLFTRRGDREPRPEARPGPEGGVTP